MVARNLNPPTPVILSELLAQDALIVAPALIGLELAVRSPLGMTGGIIVETEAYRADDDPASHAYHTRTTRNTPMFLAGGAVYCYLSYGLHTMLNLVTGPADNAQAVLIRAIEPTIGIELMMERRRTTSLTALCSGPAKLTQALGISLSDSGIQLGAKIIVRVPDSYIKHQPITASKRIGITRGTELLWRFNLPGSSFISRH